MENDVLFFINDYETAVKEISKQAALAYFNVSISGKSKDYHKASELQLQLEKFYSNKKQFEKVTHFKNSHEIKNLIIKYQIDLIYNLFAGNQIDDSLLEEIVNLSTKIEQTFSTNRAEISDKKVTDNEIDEILKKDLDTVKLKTTWEASDKFIKKPFAKLKDKMDDSLSKHYGVDKSELMPWNYQDKFFQQGPSIYQVDLDKYFAHSDITEITRNYYQGIGLDIANLFEKSDLFEKEEKYQHAYCTHIDREGDVRVLCNIKPNQQWMSTMLHEFGHAVYDKYISQNLPWSLKQPSHIFVTEAIAMLFGRMATNAEWFKDVMNISDEEKEKIGADCNNSIRMEQLGFSRWIQVVYRFEKELYQNPEQDLNSLWWQLVEKYQLLTKPKGRNSADRAAKVHIALYPAYYHNYMLGELLASQLYFYIKNKVIKTDLESVSFYNQKDVGAYLINLFFSYGSLYCWDKLIETATGENLNPKYFAGQFVNN